MATRFITASILVIGLALLMGTTGEAKISGQSTTQTSCTTELHLAGFCSIEVEGLLKGLGNVNKNPTAFTATIRLISGSIFCKNPAGNSLEASGTPFNSAVIPTIEGADAIEQAQVTINGKALSDIEIHDAAMLAALAQAGFTHTCQNANWIQIVVVTKLEVLGTQVSDPDPANTTCFLTPGPNQDFVIDGTCQTDDSLRNSCQLPQPYFNNPKSAVWKEIPYTCNEICHSTDPTQCNLTTP